MGAVDNGTKLAYEFWQCAKNGWKLTGANGYNYAKATKSLRNGTVQELFTNGYRRIVGSNGMTIIGREANGTARFAEEGFILGDTFSHVPANLSSTDARLAREWYGCAKGGWELKGADGDYLAKATKNLQNGRKQELLVNGYRRLLDENGMKVLSREADGTVKMLDPHFYTELTWTKVGTKTENGMTRGVYQWVGRNAEFHNAKRSVEWVYTPKNGQNYAFVSRDLGNGKEEVIYETGEKVIRDICK